MIKSFAIVLFIFFASQAIAVQKKEVVVTIGGHPISREEFEANYRKNNSNILYEKDKKTPTDYLGLYIDFKLKVLEAQRLGYDTAKAFVDELKGYRKELVKPYMTNVAFNDEMVQTEYHRTLYERKASHILIRVAPDTTPADTLAAWNKINDLRTKIIDGADFNETAAKLSEDPSAAQNKGLLGYFGAFQMVYPFEDMTYKTPVGQVSEIVRTRFGYHLIKVHDERVAPGELKVAHIMKMFPQQASEETIAKLKLSADSIWQKAVAGADFAELAKKYSDDKQSAPSGGILNWFTQTNMIPAFAEAAFALKSDGDISPVIRTPYGWHIIKRLELRKTLSFDKLRPELEDKIKKNPSISKYSDEAFDRELRVEYHLNIDEKNFNKLLAVVSDSVKSAGLFSPESQEKGNSLFTFANLKYTSGDFIDYLKSQNYSPATKNQEADLKARLDKFINLKLLAYEDSQLERKHPDFARIYQEYHDGILLFNISKDKIWDAASADTARLQNYFDHTTKKYYWNDRFKGLIIEAKDAETRTKIETMLDQKEMSKDEISDIFNTKTNQSVKITDVSVEKGDNPVVDYFIWSGPKPAGFDETTTFVHGKIAKNELKDLKDAWGLYSSDFQDEIEKEWIASLHKKYPVVINKRVLKKIPAIE